MTFLKLQETYGKRDFSDFEFLKIDLEQKFQLKELSFQSVLDFGKRLKDDKHLLKEWVWNKVGIDT